MKKLITKKEAKATNTTILKVGYCTMQALLHFHEPYAYSAGKYGWSCDYYLINGYCISTGYRAIGQDTDYNIKRVYEDQARSIQIDYNLSREERKERTEKLLLECISELVK